MIYAHDHDYMNVAKRHRKESKCEGRIVGCVLVCNGSILARGTNTLPTGCQHHPERVLSPGKYEWVEHAERSAIYSAARRGVSLQNATAYSTLFPCTDCARGLIESGVNRLVSYAPDFDDPKWGEAFKTSIQMFREAGVDVEFLGDD